MDKSEKLLNFMQELARLLMKYRFTLWSCESIDIYNIADDYLASNVSIGYKDGNTILYSYTEHNNDHVRGEYYEKSEIMD